MINITDEIIQTLKEVEFPFPIKDVRHAYDNRKPTHPMIIVYEVENSTLQMIHGKEIYSTLAYRIECVSTDNVFDGKVVSRREIVTSILQEVDKAMGIIYGFKRIGTPQMMPNMDDQTIMRSIATYRGNVNNETGYIYQ